MKVEAFKSVKITNQYVIDFLSVNANNDVLLSACEDVLERFCRLSSDFMDTHAKAENNKKESSAMLGILREMDKTLISRLDEMSISVDKSLSSVSSAVADRVSGQLSGLMTAMCQTVDRLDVNKISSTVNESIKVWLNMTMRDANKELKDVVEKQISDFMTKNVIDIVRESKEEMMEKITDFPSRMQDIMDESDMTCAVKNVGEELDKFMQTVKQKMSKLEDKLEGHMKTYEKISDIQGKCVTQELKNIPMLTKGVISDVLSKLESESNSVVDRLSTTIEQLRRIETEMSKNKQRLNIMTEKMDTMDKKLVLKRTNNSVKGSDGEERLYDMISEKLLARDGYVVENVSGQAQCCDIVVKREKYPTIRIESKAHGKDTNEKVRYKEVEKFQRDLLQLNNHGVFVSLYSGIVGIANFEIQQLSNGKFAVYLSNNNFDVDVIIDMIQLLYKLDRIVNNNTCDEDENKVSISVEALMRIKSYIRDYSNKINSIKLHMKESISLLSEVQMDMIESVLLGQEAENKKDTKSGCESHNCEWCNSVFSKKNGLSKHKLTCRSKPLS
jgi:hypothetical protein